VKRPRAIALAFAAILLLWTFGIYQLSTLWYSLAEYSYGWFVPLLCLCLFWERWQRRPIPLPPSATTGPLLVGALLLLGLTITALFLEVLPAWRAMAWALGFGVIGLSLVIFYLLGGPPWLRHFAFPIAFFLIAIPWHPRLEMPVIEHLSKLNAAISTWLANVLGTPAIRKGVLIETGSGLVGIDDACSGIRSFQAALMVALFLGELFRYGLMRRVLFLVSGAGLAFAGNIVRTTFLVRVCDLRGNSAVNLYHDPAGFSILVATLAGLLVLAWLLRRRGPAVVESASESRPDAEIAPAAVSGSRAPAVLFAALCGWIVLVAVGIEYWFRSGERPVATSGGWTVQTSALSNAAMRPISEAIRKKLRYDEGAYLSWANSGAQQWELFYLRWLPAKNRYRASEAVHQARGHSTDVCLQLAGMTLQTNLGVRMQQVNGVSLLTKTERYLDRGQPVYVFSGYWEPDAASINDQGLLNPARGEYFQQALRAVAHRNRGRTEKRVLKMAVSGIESDEGATQAFDEVLRRLLAPG
jgi:exosortase